MTEKPTPEIEIEVKPKSKKKSVNRITKKTNQTKQKMYEVAIEASLGTITDVARRLKVTTGAVTLYFNKNPKMKALFDSKRMSNVDIAEGVLFQHLNFKNRKDPVPAARVRQKAAEYVTSRLGRNNDWVEKVDLGGEITHQVGSIEIIMPTPDIIDNENTNTSNEETSSSVEQTS